MSPGSQSRKNVQSGMPLPSRQGDTLCSHLVLLPAMPMLSTECSNLLHTALRPSSISMLAYLSYWSPPKRGTHCDRRRRLLMYVTTPYDTHAVPPARTLTC